MKNVSLEKSPGLFRSVLKSSSLPWIIVFMAGIFLAFFRIGHESLWYDESYSAAAAGHPVLTLIPMVGGDSHPPLYFILLRIYSLIFGRSELALRSFSVLGLTALASLGMYPLRKIWNTKGALVFSVLCFITPVSIIYAQEVRMYTWTAFFVTAMVLFGYLAFSENSLKNWIVLTICSLCAAYSHYFGLLAAFMGWFLFLIVLLIKKRQALQKYGICAAVLFAAYGPWFFFLFRQTSRVVKHFWIKPVNLQTIYHVLLYPFNYKFENSINHFALAGLILAGGLTGFGIYFALKKKERAVYVPGAALLIFTLTLFAAFLLSLFVKPILISRYMLSCLGLYILVISYGLSKITIKPLFITGLGLYALIAAPVLFNVYTKEFNGPARAAYRELKDQVNSRDIFIHSNEHALGTFSYYFPDNYHYLYIPEEYIPFSNYLVFGPPGSFGSQYEQFLPKRAHIWNISLQGEPYSLPSTPIINHTNRQQNGGTRNFYKKHSLYNFSAKKYEFRVKGTKTAGDIKTGTIAINLSGIKEKTGTIIYVLYDKGPHMPETPYLKAGLISHQNGQAAFSIPELPYGKYALLLFNDVNGNYKLDPEYAIPREGFCFSGNPDLSAYPPDFDDTLFTLESKQKKMDLTLIYK